MTDQGTLTDHDREAHEKNHLCMLVEARQMKTVADLSRNPQYICRACGRVAANAGNLCEPAKL
ncbi:MAG: hypothetical protein ACYC4L_01550 [Chloroflexota bacterium]